MEGYQKKISLAEDIQLLKALSRKHGWAKQLNAERVLLQEGKVILITNPLLQISFASSNMIYMNSYLPREVIGKTPAIFQGPETSVQTKAVIREAIRNLQPFHVTLLNYRKGGSVYRCGIEAFPVFNTKGRHTHFIALEKIIPDDY